MVNQSIQESLSSSDRFKLCVLPSIGKGFGDNILRLHEYGIPTIDIGLAIASFINSSLNYAYLSIESYDFTKKLLEEKKTKPSGSKNGAVALFNFGILFEPSLDLNPKILLKEFSKSTVLILLWEDQIEEAGILHWPSQKNTHYLDFSDLPLKRISI